MTSDTPSPTNNSVQHGQTITLPSLASDGGDATRAAKHANLTLGSRFSAGDEVRVLYLERIEPKFFATLEKYYDADPTRDPLYGAFKRDPDVIAIPANADPDSALPDEFHPHEPGWSQ